jgi:hypothetical protein
MLASSQVAADRRNDAETDICLKRNAATKAQFLRANDF